jgi:hypothetical protein
LPDISLNLFGGLGTSQLFNMRDRFKNEPRVRIGWGGDSNAYRLDLGAFAQQNRLPLNVGVTHSMAGIPGAKAMQYYDVYDLMIFLDPVSEYSGVDSWEMPSSRCKFVWIRHKPKWYDFWPLLGITKPLKFLNAGEPEIFDDSHNGLPNNPAIIARVAAEVLSLKTAASATAAASGLPPLASRPAWEGCR